MQQGGLLAVSRHVKVDYEGEVVACCGVVRGGNGGRFKNNYWTELEILTVLQGARCSRYHLEAPSVLEAGFEYSWDRLPRGSWEHSE